MAARSQPRLPGTLPPLPALRKAHREAVAREREAEKIIANYKDAMRAAREGLKRAQADRRATEDDLDASDEGRRP